MTFASAKGDYTENRQIAEQERKRCKAMGVDVNRVYSLDELVRGNDILFSATGVTGGELVNGIQQTANGVRTQTLLIGGADQTCNIIDSRIDGDLSEDQMATLTEDDVLEQLDAQDNLFSFMKTAHTILLQGIRQFLPSLFVDNDEEIVEYAVKPLLAQSGPLDDIDVALRLIYALGKMDKWLYADITHFSQFWHYLNEQDETPGFADDMTWDFISNVNSITRNAMLYDALKAMKFADFSVWSEARFSGMVKTALTLAVTTTLKELTPEN